MSESADDPDDSDEISPDERYARWLYGMGAFICCVTICVFVYIEVKVLQKVGKSDKIIQGMLLML